MILIVYRLYALFNIPDKGTQTEQRIVNINLLQTVEEWLYTLIFAHGNNSLVHCRPCMCAEVWFTSSCAAASYLRKDCITTAERRTEGIDDVVVVCLVVCYEYCFHKIQKKMFFTIYSTSPLCGSEQRDVL